MKPHTKIYLKFFDYGLEDFMPCEICRCQAVDIHHIESRGMGGTSKKDEIENLIGLCRTHHLRYGDVVKYKDYLKEIHKQFMERYGTGSKVNI